MSKKRNEPRGAGIWFFFGIATGGILGFIAGLLLASSDEKQQTYDESKDSAEPGAYNNWQAKARDFAISTRDRIIFASEEGRRAAQRARYNTWLDDWDLDNPEF